jgi:hypothetical protein
MSTSRPSQVENGKAFEFAVAAAFSKHLDATIDWSRDYENSQRCYRMVSLEKQENFRNSATTAVAHILKLERARLGPQSKTRIRLNADREGQIGDVRDILVQLGDFEFGVSCKTNHDAFKHSRLSGKIDFVKKWGLSSNGCSQTYWERVRPVFNELAEIRRSSNATARWSDLDRVPERFYWPVLDSFEDELLRLSGQGADSAPQVTKNLVTYLVGKQDFYKVIDRSRHDVVEILAFNFNESLSVARTRVPEHVIGIDRLNGGQYSKTVRFSRGFTFNFRIHSASKRVEPSLKFDVTAVSLPPSDVYTNHIKLMR